ncbi:MAG: mechanosensitive ion channel protein MscS [Chlamydiae bacterium CG10_big_fil_rev_8_21_14_0_10_42_34]|nr:MAG: mechanosensitive ion channel protein MscS [Chlamydiae bacterium CG10_big_fil_rev_8_21_14_0_10_42_34]
MTFLFQKIALFLIFAVCSTGSVFAQSPVPGEVQEKDKKESLQAPEKVEAKPTTRDDEIQKRLEDILNSTGWFVSPQVKVNNGVVFLSGEAKTEEYKKWAGSLSRNTRDVTAVVNKIEVMEPSIWDYQIAVDGLKKQWVNLLRAIPSMVLGIIILVCAWGIAKLVATVIRRLLRNRLNKALLEDVIARAFGFLAFLIGVYVVFEMADLTNLALTVMGGTGLLGIILGIAFRDITENFLASVLLSIHNPFRNGDLVEIEGITGYVQRLTIRVTVLMSLDGSLIQIPNSTVYKSNLRNFSSNPNRREEFVVGIGYEDVISDAQEVAMKVLQSHPAVLKTPEPWVLVDNFGKSTVNLKVYFWLDGKEHSWLKVRSSVIRLVKRGFQLGGISMPDEAREIVFPKGVPLSQLEPKIMESKDRTAPNEPGDESKEVATNAESGLQSEAKEIKKQGSQADLPEAGKDFLKEKNHSK